MMNRRYVRTMIELADREVANGGRWVEIKLKKTHEVVRVVRRGYGPMEYPQNDNHDIEINGEVVAQCGDLYEVAEWLCNRI